MKVPFSRTPGGTRSRRGGGRRTPRAPASPVRSVLLQHVLDRVLDVLDRVLEAGFGLVGLALRTQFVVAGPPARRFLGLAAEVVGLVPDLVAQGHVVAPRVPVTVL